MDGQERVMINSNRNETFLYKNIYIFCSMTDRL